MQDKYEQRSMRSLNEIIVKDGVAAGLLKVEKDLIFFGQRNTTHLQNAGNHN